MKKICLLLFIAVSFGTKSFSQTKKIAHRSHSGKDITFNTDDEDNFGLPPKRKDTAAKANTADTTSKQKTIAANKKVKIKTRKKAAKNTK